MKRVEHEALKRFSAINRATILLLLFVLYGCGSKDPNQLAEREVDRFHQRWNEDDFTGIYNDAHMRFRSVNPANVTIAMFQRGKRNFGPFKSTKKRNGETTQENGEPVIVLKYDSAYEHGAAVERFGFRMSGSAVLLSDYELRSPESAVKEELIERAQKAMKARAEAKAKGAAEPKK